MNTKKLYKCLAAVLVFSLGQIGGFCQVKVPKVNYTSFTVSAADKKVMINWKTEDNLQNNYFELERSFDGKNFKTIAIVFGPDPQKLNCNCYECFDKPSKSQHEYYYRLKCVSSEGYIELSEVKMLALR
jgi:hypothetical protein